MLYAKEGERVTCANGHHVCTVARDVSWGDIHSLGDLVDWQQPVPVAGTMATDAPCTICGARWFGGVDGDNAMALHFADGWREMKPA